MSRIEVTNSIGTFKISLEGSVMTKTYRSQFLQQQAVALMAADSRFTAEEAVAAAIEIEDLVHRAAS